MKSRALPEVASQVVYDYMIGRNEPGAIPCGTRVRKGPLREDDLHEEGALGVVRGTCGPFPHEGEPSVYGYLIEFDDTPGMYVFVHDGRNRLLVDEMKKGSP